MDYRHSLQQLLQKLLPTLVDADVPFSAQSFADTCPGEDASTPRARQRRAGSSGGSFGLRSAPALDVVLASELMAYPEDAAAGTAHG